MKIPENVEDQKRYAPFVQAVTESVKDWPFELKVAEVHVDVLFEIE